ncbi:glycosyltransferase family protein [Anaeromyxobacter dehalogenans]|uniref:Teichoic acid biosynthesis related protein n=1 Tax=Anaeromyxobacter dehalogenans (strain 2CP-C) TaxID=290397 RepID=Q2IMH3_ANADE|nr:glycosyltransferase family protein [Anaeromyxobacter dehalogenans]ABC80009.1 teichoic acid biosynthesis related protein [Anaeromyxobacter dehalogenans 2CP-C]
MARILYGVAGEGMGHAVRSRVVIDHLARTHDVQVVVSGRAHDYLKARERDHLGVNRIWGLSIVYEDNEVRNFRTVLKNVGGAVAGGWPRNVKAYFDLTESFRPEVVVSDFETWSYLYARTHGLPCVSVDNNQAVNRCDHPPEILAGHEAEYLVAKGVVKAKLPGCFHYLIATFFQAPVAKPRTSLHPPVLRPEILSARAEPGAHLLVYQTSTSNEALPDVLRGAGVECRVYGLRRDLTADAREGNLVHRPFSEARFVEDLRTARAVISGGSFTLMTEAVYLHKPMLAIPVKRQFEQVLNARYLQALGYGATADDLDARVLGDFLARLPDLERGLSRYRQDGNRELLAKLDDVLARALDGGEPAEPRA